MTEPQKKKLDLHRREMPKQSPEVRRFNFSEVALGYTPELAREEAARCLQCKKPLCVNNCPVEINIPGFIKLIGEGDFPGAIRVLKEKNLLPAMCGRVCPQEEQCEKTCVLVKKGGQVAVGRLERFAADWEASQGTFAVPDLPPSTGRKVAVVGGGNGGLACARPGLRVGAQVRMI